MIEQLNSPGKGWNLLTYNDVVNYNNSNNQNLLYERNNPVTAFSQSTINFYKNYYTDLANTSFENNNVDPNEVIQFSSTQSLTIMDQIQSLYTDDKLTQQLQNYIQFGKLKTSYYNGIEQNDFLRYDTQTNFDKNKRSD